MTLRRAQAGAVGVMLVALLVIIMVILVASQMLSRIADVSREESNAAAGLQRAMAALEGFASTAQRLPCPANPTLDTGFEVPVGPSPNCTFPEGTLPWRTIGLKRDDAYDPWARKLSYRVFSGASGLTQTGGVSMVNCDTNDTGPAVAGGLCNPGATVYERDTGSAQFLAGKGYKLTDTSAAPVIDVADVAYVILSHGPTGLGGYTVSGDQLPTPKGDEKKNTNATGDFFIHAHSDYDVESDSSSHFDDLLAYRRLGDLIKRLGLGARDWPES